jgi:hypothetical protein
MAKRNRKLRRGRSLADDLDELNTLPSGAMLKTAVTALFSLPTPPELRTLIGDTSDARLQVNCSFGLCPAIGPTRSTLALTGGVAAGSPRPQAVRVISSRRTVSDTSSCGRINGSRSASRGGGWRTSDRFAVTAAGSASANIARVLQPDSAAAGASTASKPALRAAAAMSWVRVQSSDTRSALLRPRRERVASSVRSRTTRSTQSRPTRQRTSKGWCRRPGSGGRAPPMRLALGWTPTTLPAPRCGRGGQVLWRDPRRTRAGALRICRSAFVTGRWPKLIQMSAPLVVSRICESAWYPPTMILLKRCPASPSMISTT